MPIGTGPPGQSGETITLSARPPALLTGHTDAVWWGAWATVDGRPVLATGGADHTVRLWPGVAERGVERLLACYRSGAAPGLAGLPRSAEAAAVAELVTARSVRPPLAIG